MHRIIFQIGPFTLYSYGLFVALAFLISSLLILRDAKKFNISRETALDGLIAILIGGLIGARLLFVFINWDYFLEHPLRIFMLHEGGLAIQGALIAAFLAGLLITKIKKIPFWKGADLIAPYIALGESIGRIGCFLNGCCYGKIIEHGIGVTFPDEEVMRMPVQIYSSLFLLMLFIFLIAIRKKRLFDGYVFSVYLILYGIFRFFMDFFRGDELAMVSGITLSQAISIGIFVCGVVLYWGRFSKCHPSSRRVAL